MRFTLVNRAAKIGELTIKYSNLPERYIQRCTEVVYYKSPPLPQYRKVTLKRDKTFFDVHRPWTPEFQKQNALNKNKRKIYVEPIAEWSIFRGDRVEILVGKDKGKHGIVVQIIQERNWVIVEGMNTYLKVVGKTTGFPGMLIQQEAPLLVTTEVSLVDPSDLKPTKIEWRFTEDGDKVRVCSRSGRVLPMPSMAEETYDYKSKAAYKEKPKDTPADEVARATFEPSLQTFEMDLMQQYGIQEDRVPVKSYWY